MSKDIETGIGYSIVFSTPRPTRVYGMAGNSRYSDWEIAATIILDDGTTFDDVFSTRQGAHYWANKRVIQTDKAKQNI